MPKPPTSERGRARRPAPAPEPERRRLSARRSAPGRLRRGRDGRAGISRTGAGDSLRAALNWRAYVSPLLCLAGVGVSIYLTIAHFTGAPLAACTGKGFVDCTLVTSSPQSVVFGVYVSIWGLAYFVAMFALCLPPLWRSANRYVAPLRVLGAVAGIGMVFYLVYSELFTIKAICLWCTSVHALTFVLFVVVVTGWEHARAPYWEAIDADEGED